MVKPDLVQFILEVIKYEEAHPIPQQRRKEGSTIPVLIAQVEQAAVVIKHEQQAIQIACCFLLHDSAAKKVCVENMKHDSNNLKMYCFFMMFILFRDFMFILFRDF